MTDRRIVVDTNVWISSLIYPASVPGRACRKAFTHFKPVFTEETIDELRQVLQRKKFQKLFLPDEREKLLHAIQSLSDIVPVTRPIKACRDPGDDKFLEAAVHGGASHVITGDADLLMLHPFMGAAIVTPVDFLKNQY